MSEEVGKAKNSRGTSEQKYRFVRSLGVLTGNNLKLRMSFFRMRIISKLPYTFLYYCIFETKL